MMARHTEENRIMIKTVTRRRGKVKCRKRRKDPIVEKETLTIEKRTVNQRNKRVV